MISKRIILSIFLIFPLLFLTSCLSRIESRGYTFELADYKVKKGLSSKEEIVKNMGSPTLISYMDDKSYWIYYEEKVQKLLFFRPKIVKRDVLMLTFNSNDIVDNLGKYSLKNQNSIRFSADKTAVRDVKKSLAADLFGNIGTVAPQ